MLVDLDQQVDLDGLDLIGGRRERREQVIAALAELAGRSQARLVPFLERARRDGMVRSWQRFTIVNRLLVEATPEGIEALSRRPEVAAVIPEEERPEPALMTFPSPGRGVGIKPGVSTPGQSPSQKIPSPRGTQAARLRPFGAWREGRIANLGLKPQALRPRAFGAFRQEEPPRDEKRTSWAIEAVGAPAAWALGLDGTGVVVGVVDSGASDVHEQLAAGFRGGGGGGGGERSWLDPSGEHATPRDTRFGHGTGVLSVAVGRNTSGITLGIAPGAQWIACAALPRGRYNNILATQCADWMLNVGQPDVVVASWVLPEGGCDRSLERIVAAWRAAGILPVFAAGNYGPGERTDRSPANYESVLSVGGLSPGGGAFAATSQGPSACGSHVFPRIAAPAEELIAAFPLGRSTYLTAKGTSFAAGIAAGAAAILIQRRPDALVSELEKAFGYGRLDIPAALERLQSSEPSEPSIADRTTGIGGPP